MEHSDSGIPPSDCRLGAEVIRYNHQDSSKESPGKAAAVKTNRVRRIPTPAILPPILDKTTSSLHLGLTNATGSLQKQVDHLVTKHRVVSHKPPGPKIASGPAAPPMPPKDQPKMTAIRKPLPHPPANNDILTYHNLSRQFPVSCGGSISKIHSLSTQPIRVTSGVPTGMRHPQSLTPGGGKSMDRQLALHPFPLSSNADQSSQGLQSSLPATGTVSRSFAKGGASVLLHNGFFDLLSLSTFQTRPLPYGGNLDPKAHLQSEGWLNDGSARASIRAITAPVFGSQVPHSSTGTGISVPLQKPLAARGKGRISVDMVGKPTGFTCVTSHSKVTELTLSFIRHLVHASDAEQAEEILTRWRIDGNGKLAGPLYSLWKSFLLKLSIHVDN